jgi:transposase
MKDGTTHLAHKAEHAVDMESGAVIAVALQAADTGDTMSLYETLAEAGETVERLAEREAAKSPAEERQVNADGMEEVVADKGYHSGAVVIGLGEVPVRSYLLRAATRTAQLGGKSG